MLVKGELGVSFKDGRCFWLGDDLCLQKARSRVSQAFPTVLPLLMRFWVFLRISLLLTTTVRKQTTRKIEIAINMED